MTDSEVIIYSDSYTVVISLEAMSFISQIALDCRISLNEMTEQFNIYLIQVAVNILVRHYTHANYGLHNSLLSYQIISHKVKYMKVVQALYDRPKEVELPLATRHEKKVNVGINTNTTLAKYGTPPFFLLRIKQMSPRIGGVSLSRKVDGFSQCRNMNQRQVCVFLRLFQQNKKLDIQ